MTTKSSFRKTVEKLSEQAGDPNLGPCRWCNTLTAWATLSQLGARCQSCYDTYCAEGVRGGRDGYLQGAPDTADQREMRKRLKVDRPTGNAVAKVEPEVDTRARDAAKRETDRRVADYAQRNGLSLADSATLLDGGRNATHEKASAFEEPAWVREGYAP